MQKAPGARPISSIAKRRTAWYVDGSRPAPRSRRKGPTSSCPPKHHPHRVACFLILVRSGGGGDLHAHTCIFSRCSGDTAGHWRHLVQAPKRERNPSVRINRGPQCLLFLRSDRYSRVRKTTRRPRGAHIALISVSSTPGVESRITRSGIRPQQNERPPRRRSHLYWGLGVAPFKVCSRSASTFQ